MLQDEDVPEYLEETTSDSSPEETQIGSSGTLEGDINPGHGTLADTQRMANSEIIVEELRRKLQSMRLCQKLPKTKTYFLGGNFTSQLYPYYLQWQESFLQYLLAVLKVRECFLLLVILLPRKELYWIQNKLKSCYFL